MIKSIAFFLAVFALGLVALLIVSGDLNRWLHPAAAPVAREPGDEGPAGSGEGKSKEGAPPGSEPNRFKVDIFDPLKGRLEYTIRGHLNESDLKNLQDIQQLDAAGLHDGQIEVPIYEDFVGDLPANASEEKPKQFVLTFADAEYRAYRKPALAGIDKKPEREREVVTLSKGVGKTDDGSSLHFDELTFEIDRNPPTENQFAIRSRKPVSIRYGYLYLESPNGMDGVVLKSKGLQRLSFLPPVKTYIDPKAANLFSLGKAGAVPSAAAGSSPGQGKADSKQAVELPATGSRVAVTCEGPLTFLFSAEPATIRFEKDVSIYPFEGPAPEEGRPAPPIGATWFQCQLLTIEVDRKSKPSRPARAIATWEGGRVEAHHFGNIIDGDRLVWSFPEPPSGAGGEGQKTGPKAAVPPEPSSKAERGVAILTGRPRITGEQGWLETGEAAFELDEDRILLRGGLVGVFQTAPIDPGALRGGKGRGARKTEAGAAPPSQGPEAAAGKADARPAAAGEPKAAEPALGEFQQEWDFRAEEGEIVFRQAAPPPEGSRKRSFQGPTASKVLASLIARSSKDEGLEIQSKGDGRYRLTGRILVYDAQARTVTVEGSEAQSPWFQAGKNHGTARSILLRVDEGIAVLRDEVRILVEDLQGIDSRLAPGSKSPASPPDSAPDRPQQPPATAQKEPGPAGAAEGSKPAPVGVGGPVEFLADEMELRFQSKQLLGIAARSKADGGSASPARPVVLRNLAPGSSYRLTGARMSWNHLEEVARVQGAKPGETSTPGVPPGILEPELEFEGGKLAADEIRFDRKAWKVDLLGRVEIRGSLRLKAGKAEVLLNENLAENPNVDCGPSKDLRRVQRIQAWAEEGGMMEFSSEKLHYRGRAQEAAWDSRSQELHIFGTARQELTLSDGEKESLVTAEDIIYSCQERKIVLKGGVKCTIKVLAEGFRPQKVSPEGAKVSGTAAEGKDGTAKAAARKVKEQKAAEPLVFDCETTRLEADVEETPQGLAPTTVRAFEKVLLTNSRYGIQLRGDECLYDHQRQELVIFSREGRTQKLTRTHLPAQEAGKKAEKAAPQEPLSDQIEAREIRVTYKLVPPQPQPGGTAASVEEAIVKFRDDVNANFYASMKSSLLPAAEAPGSKEEWKMQSDHLGVRLVPRKEGAQAVELALAEGNVMFKSGEYMALANEAIYEGALRKLILRGTHQKPASLFIDTKKQPISKVEIFISNLGEQKLDWGTADKLSPEPPGLQELRRGAPKQPR